MNIKQPIIKKKRISKPKSFAGTTFNSEDFGKKTVDSLKDSGELKRHYKFSWIDAFTLLFITAIIIAIINGVVSMFLKAH